MNQTTAATTLIYGSSRTYKSTQMAQVSEYVYNATGGRSCRMVSTETSSAEIFAPYVDAGLIQNPFWLRMAHHPRSSLRKIIRGDWGQLTKMPDGSMKYQFQPTTPDQWKGIGAYIFEGLTTFAELIMIELINTGRKINEDVVGLYKEGADMGGGDIMLGAAARSHYGAVQQDILFILKEASKALYDASGGMVQHVFFTSHQNKGQDEQKDTVYGPATVGKAITGSIQKEVGLLIHHDEVVEKGTKKVRAHFQSHGDAENPNMIWQAGSRSAPSAKVAAALANKWPGGFYELSLDPPMGLVQFLEFHDQLRKAATIELAQRISQRQADNATRIAQDQLSQIPKIPKGPGIGTDINPSTPASPVGPGVDKTT